MRRLGRRCNPRLGRTQLSPAGGVLPEGATLRKGMAMSTNDLEVSNGPDKAGLLRAVTNPDQHLHVSFDTAAGAVEAHIDAIEEGGDDGLTFALRGHLTSGNVRGAIPPDWTPGAAARLSLPRRHRARAASFLIAGARGRSASQ
jgi:hypothetical protein